MLLKILRDSIVGAWIRRVKHRRQALSLLDTDPRLLRDMGLMQEDIEIATNRYGSIGRDATTRLRIMAVERRAIERQDAVRQRQFLAGLLPLYLHRSDNAKIDF